MTRSKGQVRRRRGVPLRLQYALFVLLLHGAATAGAFYAFREQKWVFLLVELVLLASLAWAAWLYRAFMRPVSVLKSGADAMADGDFSVRYRPTGVPETDRLIRVYNAMIDHLRAERVRTTELGVFLQRLMAESPVGILVLDYDGRAIDQVNARALALLADEVSGQGQAEDPYRLSEGIMAMLERLRRAGQPEVQTLAGGRQVKCHAVQVVHQGFPKTIAFLEEVTGELLRAQKEAYGKIIRMMAHEMNNSAAAVNSILQTVHDEAFDTGHPDGEAFREALQVAIGRNQNLVQFMDNFANLLRLPQPSLMRTDLHELLTRVLRLFQAQHPGMTMRMDMPDTPLHAQADPVQLEQALLNILKNAAESAGPEGTVWVTLAEGRLIIADNGPGVAPDDAPHLFTPFFSTKPQGQGIGLMLVQDILRHHGMAFGLSTGPDGWTRFEVVF